jgi:hypothetical protein
MVMKRPARVSAGSLSVCLLLLIIARSLGELLRLGAEGAAAKPARMYVIGALIAVASAFAVTVLQAYGRRNEVVGVTVLTVAGLFIYKLAAG